VTTFNVLASTAYRLSITEPTVAGNPAPTISYAWSYNGTPIGGNNRIVNAYTFPSLPGTLSCTVTATNWGGSVSETATATIAEQVPVPVLNAVSIRVASAPTAIVTELPSATAGAVLTVGGPVPASTAPTGLNIGSLAYQWRRNGIAIAGATSQTYTLVAADIDTTLSVQVTASNAGQSDVEYAVVRIGNAAANARSIVGGHGPDVEYWASSLAFANLTYSNRPFWSDSNINGDAWRIGSAATANYLIGATLQGRLSMLGIKGVWDPNTVSDPNPNNTEYGIVDNYRVKYKVTVYWEGGEGRAQITNNPRTGSDAAIVNQHSPPQTSAAFSTATVQFTNGDPFGEGAARSFYKRTTEFGPVSVRSLKDHTVSVYANGATDPFRNAIILVHDVQKEVGGANSGVWETVYAGFTHENYTPFTLYPAYVDAMRHFKTLRYLAFQWAHGPGNANGSVGGVAQQGMISVAGENITGWQFPYTDTWLSAAERAEFSKYRDLPPTFGTAWGFGNLNRPTHAHFGRSLRAAVEICSALGCDLWWNHPFHSTYVGNTPGEVKLREAYFQLFAETVNQHLAPGLKVYSEWGNETWNDGTSPYYHGVRYAQNQALKLANANGDLVIRDYTSVVASNNTWWSNLSGQAFTGAFAYNAASSAKIASFLRPLMPGRELVAVWSSQDGGGGVRGEVHTSAFALWQTMPWVFDELDAYAVAPYRTPPVNNAAVEAGTLTITAAFDAIQSAGWLLPWNDPASRWYSTSGEYNTNQGRPGWLEQKNLALDLVNTYTTPGDSGKRRWNLRLIAYEAGQHAVPGTPATSEFQRKLQYEPRYYDFYYRYYEALTSPGPSPVVTARQADGYFGLKSQVTANAEPLYDMVCELTPIGHHRLNNSPFSWGLQQFNGELGAPKAEAVRQIVINQPWSNA
jgi:hypothetical protein